MEHQMGAIIYGIEYQEDKEQSNVRDWKSSTWATSRCKKKNYSFQGIIQEFGKESDR